ncbi:MAG: short-chain dehydrogenase [Candidatus Kapabacteria bacterium]|nr:short-chain dehydrogenase [Ignavibacteriota bacterium]MCW5884364.1 short-chain dehydrogenase [Candidatus Kapabacteria bacterium]
MEIKGSKILVLGGWGLVGSAICRKLMEHNPSQLIISSLKESEALDAVEQMKSEYPDANPEMFVPKWGNIFTRTDWKDLDFRDVLTTQDKRKIHIKDIFYELSDDVVKNSALYKLIVDTKPDLVIDCINTATAIAYLNIYSTVINAIKRIEDSNLDEALVEQIIASSYIPQLIRHIQLLYTGLQEAGTRMYFKIGTSGTGGMGFNIPYTHSEERPSRVLLSKNAVAGAQTLLLYILARTPGGPVVKEIKPTAAIAWKKIAYGDVKRRGQAIELVDMPFESAKPIDGYLHFDDKSGVSETGDTFKSVYIDTGENGIFSRGEFQAISSLGQMEIITPEEIADYLVFEVLGGNTGKDVIQGLDAFTMGPTYRGGMLRNVAMNKLDELEHEHGVNSVAFELLGPPRLSKLLYEAYLLKRICGAMNKVSDLSAEELSEKAEEILKSDNQLRQQILSIGIAVMMKDGKNYLRGKDIKIPVRRGDDKLEMTEENVNQWCYDGWIDLRKQNFVVWKKRIEDIMNHSNSLPNDDTSSRFTYTNDFWDKFENIDEGKVVSWIFEFEDKGWRFKR